MKAIADISHSFTNEYPIFEYQVKQKPTSFPHFFLFDLIVQKRLSSPLKRSLNSFEPLSPLD